MYLFKIIQVCVCCCVLCVKVRALGEPVQDNYPSVCAAVYCVSGAEPLANHDYSSVCAAVHFVTGKEPFVYLIKIFHVCVLLCTMC